MNYNTTLQHGNRKYAILSATNQMRKMNPNFHSHWSSQTIIFIKYFFLSL